MKLASRNRRRAAPGEPTRSGPAAQRYLIFALKAAAGIAMIGLLFWKYDTRAIIGLLRKERTGFFVAAVALYLFGQVISAWRWQMLAARLNVRGPFREFLAYTFIGVFTNLFLPGLVGGDAARAIYLGRRHRRMAESAATVVADRGSGLLALFWLAAASAAALGSTLPTAIIKPAIALGGLTLAAYLTMPELAKLVRLMPPQLTSALRLATPYFRHRLTLLPAIALSLALQISLAVAQYLLGLGLGERIPVLLFLLYMPIANVLAGMPVTVNGLGVRESVYLVLFGMAGVGKPDAIALGLLWFAATFVGGLFGALPLVVTDLPVLEDAGTLGREQITISQARRAEGGAGWRN